MKYGKKLTEINKFTPEEDIEYFRELPNEDATPGEALYILEEPYNRFNHHFGKIFSATLLDLKLKDCIDLRAEKDEKGKDKIYIKIIRRENEELKPDENRILKFISGASKKTNEIEIKSLEKYIKDHSSAVLKLIEGSEKNINSQLKDQGIIDTKEKT